MENKQEPSVDGEKKKDEDVKRMEEGVKDQEKKVGSRFDVELWLRDVLHCWSIVLIVAIQLLMPNY